MHAVRLQDVSLRFGTQWALIRLTAEFPLQKSVLLTGGNGAGKTTLLRVIATALRPTRGKLELFGVDARKDLAGVRSQLGLMTHGSHLYDDLTGLENLSIVASLTGRGNQAGLGQLLERVGLAEHANRPVRAYSAGMKRRLIVARMLLREPRLALLDEPFGQLDPAGVALMRELIGELKGRGTTLIIATHLHDLARPLCDLHMDMTGGRFTMEPVEVEGQG